jgi:hypothetical protein
MQEVESQILLEMSVTELNLKPNFADFDDKTIHSDLRTCWSMDEMSFLYF